MHLLGLQGHLRLGLDPSQDPFALGFLLAQLLHPKDVPLWLVTPTGRIPCHRLSQDCLMRPHWKQSFWRFVRIVLLACPRIFTSCVNICERLTTGVGLLVLLQRQRLSLSSLWQLKDLLVRQQPLPLLLLLLLPLRLRQLGPGLWRPLLTPLRWEHRHRLASSGSRLRR